MKPFLHLFLLIPLAAQLSAQKPVTGGDNKPANIEGIVVNRLTGQPLAHAHVHLAPDSSSVVESYGAITTTEGRFSVRGVTPGAYRISVERAGFITYSPKTDDAALRAIKPGEEAKGLVIRLMPAGVISGRVVSSDEEPASGLEVFALSARRWAVATTNNKGEFRLGGLQPGSYLVRVESKKKNGADEIRMDGSRPVNVLTTFYPSSLDANGASLLEVREGAETAKTVIQLVSFPPVRSEGESYRRSSGCTRHYSHQTT